MLKVGFSNSCTALQKREALEAVRMFPENPGRSRVIIRSFSELTWDNFRRQRILESEISEYNGDLGSPILFVRHDLSLCKAKIGRFLASFRCRSASSGSAKTLFGPCCESAVSNQTRRKGMHKAPTVGKGSDSDSTRSHATAQE